MPPDDPRNESFGAFIADSNNIVEGIGRRDYFVHPFMTKFLNESGIELDDYMRLLVNICEASGRPLLASEFKPRVPRITHRVWITNPNEPYEADPDFVAVAIDCWNKCFPSTWEHYFWVLREEHSPKTIASIREKCPNVKIREAYEGLSDGAWKGIFEKLMKDRKIVPAADVLRLQLMHEFGGLYTDLGINFKRDVIEILDNFEFAFIFWETLFFQNSLLFMDKDNFITRTFQSYYQNASLYPLERLPDRSAANEMLLFSGPNITAIIVLELLRIGIDRKRIALFAPNREIISWAAQQSWYTEVEDGVGKYGNVYMPKARNSII